MAQQNINFGKFPNDPAADSTRVGFQKTDANFADLYSNGLGGTAGTLALSDGNVITSLSTGLTVTAGGALSLAFGATPGTAADGGALKAQQDAFNSFVSLFSNNGTPIVALDFAGSFVVTADGTLTVPIPQFDSTIIPKQGLFGVATVDVSTLNDAGTALPTDQIAVIRNGTVYSTTQLEEALSIGLLTKPALSIGKIPTQAAGQPFSVVVTAANYAAAPPGLQYSINGGTLTALPAGTPAPTTAGVTFLCPGLPGSGAGTDTITVTDANGVTATSNAFIESTTAATGGSITGGTIGTLSASASPLVLPGPQLTVAATPAGTTLYAVVNDPSGSPVQQGSRVAFTGNTPPAIRPTETTPGTYALRYALFLGASGSNQVDQQTFTWIV